MDPGSQRESEALRRAFRIRLNETDGGLQNADEICLASVAQVYSNLFDRMPRVLHGLPHAL